MNEYEYYDYIRTLDPTTDICYNEDGKQRFKKTNHQFFNGPVKKAFLRKFPDAKFKYHFSAGGIAVPGDPVATIMFDENNGVMLQLCEKLTLNRPSFNVLYRTVTHAEPSVNGQKRTVKHGHNSYFPVDKFLNLDDLVDRITA